MSFKRLDPEDISISAEAIVAPAWSTNAVELKTLGTVGFNRSAGQVASNTGNFYHEIYHKVASDSTSRVQFSITYGHKEGKGSVAYSNAVAGKSPSSTIYGQYRNLVFGDEEVDFNFAGQTSDDIYVIAIDRARYKEKLFPGTFNLTLSSGSGGTADPNKKLYLTDNSNDISTVSYVDAGRVYDIVSGSNGTSAGQTITNGYNSQGGTYGKFLPDVGVILLSGKALNNTLNLQGIDIATAIGTTASTEKNLDKFYNVINYGNSFKLQSEETISSNFIFVRVRNSEFNYSTNPSNITSSGELRHDVMINSPQSYITTVGLYNDNNDLLGVAKLSRPLLKDFTKEALVRIKLDY
tara:strand:+ start:16701 stop:17756 length:1056 start_codon:yes stop_codon:yes gene_type:complete